MDDITAAIRAVCRAANRHGCTGRGCAHPNHRRDVADAQHVLVALGLLPDPNPGQSLCGTPRSYRQGCRCTDCVTAWRGYMRDYMANRRATSRALVDVGPVVEHVHRLRAAGMTYRQIAEASGVHEKTVWMYTSTKPGIRPLTTHRDRAAAILAVPIPTQEE